MKILKSHPDSASQTKRSVLKALPIGVDSKSLSSLRYLGKLREKSTEKERHRRPTPSSASISAARSRAARVASATRREIEYCTSRRFAVCRASKASRSAPSLAPLQARRRRPSRSALPKKARGETVEARRSWIRRAGTAERERWRRRPGLPPVDGGGGG